MTPVYLPSQHASVHDLPVDPAALSRALMDGVAAALELARPDGCLDDPAAVHDVGDLTLGVVSLMTLAWHRGDRRDEALAAAVRHSFDFHLRERVFRDDNPGEPFLRIRSSGLPYARYTPAAGEHPFGDWPSTVWALLHLVTLLDLGPEPLTGPQYAATTDLAIGYWRWLTEASLFNPQRAGNQAIGAIVAGLTLARHLTRHGRDAEAATVRERAMDLYETEIRASRVTDRGYALPSEHGAGHDQNYAPISLTFLARAHQISGEKCFLDDGDQIARHLDARLSASGFDFGGPRYSEQHCGIEGMLGLRFFGARTGADLGRYLGDRRGSYFCTGSTGAPNGHFAFTTCWLFEDDGHWTRTDDRPRATPYSLRAKGRSVSFTARHSPYLIDAAGTAVIEAVAAHQHGIGPLLTYPAGRKMLLNRPLGPVRHRDVLSEHRIARLVSMPVVTAEQIMLTIQTAYVCDADGVQIVAVLDRSKLPPDVAVDFLAGLPYVTPEGGRLRKITSVEVPGGHRHDLAGPDPLAAPGSVLAGTMAITAGAPLRLTNPPDRPDCFNSPLTIGLTQERFAFGLAADPHGYGDPDAGWRRTAETNHLLAAPLADAPPGLAVFVVRYSPATAAAPRPLAASAQAVTDGLLVRLPGLAVLIGHPAGDAHGEPEFRVREEHR